MLLSANNYQLKLAIYISLLSFNYIVQLLIPKYKEIIIKQIFVNNSICAFLFNIL